jgi:sec-independent protein translocase protein TatB
MFDVGFSELMVIAVVALIVIGPERLPKAARTLGLLFGRLQRYVNDVKTDISREMELDELRKLQQQVKTAAHDFETSMTSAAKDVETGVRSVESELNAAAQSAESPPATPAETPPPEMLPLPPAVAEPAVAEHALERAPPAEPPPAAAEPARQGSLPGFERG